ncbi:MAG: SlyX family protein [Deltaproteobacteria bacterium]|jgi:SlyX protein|nr:SlyX family protein [Deltaproteobacteria bacterium]MBW2533951.1 SlyX family protein [Deltaproteobacteria bacterium]
MDERLTKLEIAITYQQDLLDKLNEVIIEQQGQIDRLERRLAEIEARPWAGSGYDPSAPQEPPPHY